MGAIACPAAYLLPSAHPGATGAGNPTWASPPPHLRNDHGLLRTVDAIEEAFLAPQVGEMPAKP